MQPQSSNRGLTHTLQFPSTGKNKLRTNYISTTKYNIFTFLPLAFLLQFKRYANIYFLISAIMQSIPLISPLTPFSAVAPLIFVIALSMLREGYEDYQRYKSDKDSNSRQTQVLKDGVFAKESWSKVRPADFIKVMQDQSLPADMIPIVSHSDNGIIYLETSSLDGEKNLKLKNSLKETQLLYNESASLSKMMNGHVDCIAPNGRLYEFDGKIAFTGLKPINQLTAKNLLLRGSKLKNVEWVVGLVVYTGVDTKVMMNGSKGDTKTSKIQRIVNKLILAILCFQLLCCLASSVYSYFCCVNNLVFENFLTGGTSCVDLALISFGSYFILNNTMIPISLIVSLEFVKVFQGQIMQRDKDMFTKHNEKPLKCNSVSINEELGQIEYILTDKTGTLTCNQMIFKQLIVGTDTYGSYEDPHIHFRTKSVVSLRRSEHLSLPSNSYRFSFETRGLEHDLKKNPKQRGYIHSIEEILSDKKRLLEEMLFIMSTCHECVRDPRSNEYQGPSPDEVTLVDAACHFGFEYLATQNKIIKVKLKDHIELFEFIQSFEFDSDRKRMSVVVRHNGVLKLYTKGADSAIVARLAKDQPFLQHINEKTSELSKNGLRSLMFAMRILPDSLLDNLPLDASIETELTLIGLTGIEDKLQDYVPQTIASLRFGGIKFVLLTGDKVETAQSISRSCGMIEQSITLASNQKYRIAEVGKILEKNPQLSLIIDGSIVNIEQHKELISNVIIRSQSTVFCRVTPGQKAEVVRLVKQKGKMTLAIGDGANDVNMILEAHVGVGIYGQEGMRAAQVSNYAIGEFCLLWKLLLVHGRLNYIRISEMILYFFYKNMVFTIPQFVFSFYCLGSGQSIYLSWAITLYNLLFTLIPVVIRAVFETDISVQAKKDKLKREDNDTLHTFYPKMYYIGQKNTIFTKLNFLGEFALGTMQGVVCLLVSLYSLCSLDSNSGINSYSSGFYFLEISLVTSIVIIVNVKLALNVQHWSWLLVLGFIIPTLGGYLIYVVLSDIWDQSPTEGYTNDLLTMPIFYFTLILTILGIFGIDLLIYSLKAFRGSLQNYIKYNSLRGRQLSQGKITLLDKRIREKVQLEPSIISDNIEELAESFAKKHLVCEPEPSISSNNNRPLNSLQIEKPSGDEL